MTSSHPQPTSRTTRRIWRLGWFGIEVDQDGATLPIRCIRDTSMLPSRDDRQPSPRASEGAVAGIVTHLQADRADPVALAAVLRDGAPVVRSEPVSGSGPDLEPTGPVGAAFGTSGLDARLTDAWTTREVGPFTLRGVPAVDGCGDPRPSCIVENGGRRIIHCGDTLLHGHQRRIARWLGAIGHAFLPFSGATVDVPFLRPQRDQEDVITPEGTARAARILGVRAVTPIHHGALHRPPAYVETGDPVGRPRAAGRALGAAIEVREPGDLFEAR